MLTIYYFKVIRLYLICNRKLAAVIFPALGIIGILGLHLSFTLSFLQHLRFCLSV